MSQQLAFITCRATKKEVFAFGVNTGLPVVEKFMWLRLTSSCELAALSYFAKAFCTSKYLYSLSIVQMSLVTTSHTQCNSVRVRTHVTQRQTARIESLTLKIMPLSYFCHFFHLQVSVLHLICQLGTSREACHSNLKDRRKKAKSTVIRLTTKSRHFSEGQTWATSPGAALRSIGCGDCSETSAGHQLQQEKRCQSWIPHRWDLDSASTNKRFLAQRIKLPRLSIVPL